MTYSDEQPGPFGSDINRRTGKVAVIVGCRRDEAEEIELLLDLLSWDVVRFELPSQLSESGASLAFVDASLYSQASTSSWSQIPSGKLVVGILCDTAQTAEIATILTLDTHILVRPIDLRAVETIIQMAT